MKMTTVLIGMAVLAAVLLLLARVGAALLVDGIIGGVT